MHYTHRETIFIMFTLRFFVYVGLSCILFDSELSESTNFYIMMCILCFSLKIIGVEQSFDWNKSGR